MKKSEVIKFMEDAIKHVETENISKPKFAAWLKEKFQISIKDLQLKSDEGFRPYLLVEFMNDNGKVEEAYVNMERYQDKLMSDKKLTFKDSN